MRGHTAHAQGSPTPSPWSLVTCAAPPPRRPRRPPTPSSGSGCARRAFGAYDVKKPPPSSPPPPLLQLLPPTEPQPRRTRRSHRHLARRPSFASASASRSRVGCGWATRGRRASPRHLVSRPYEAARAQILWRRCCGCFQGEQVLASRYGTPLWHLPPPQEQCEGGAGRRDLVLYCSSPPQAARKKFTRFLSPFRNQGGRLRDSLGRIRNRGGRCPGPDFYYSIPYCRGDGAHFPRYRQ